MKHRCATCRAERLPGQVICPECETVFNPYALTREADDRAAAERVGPERNTTGSLIDQWPTTTDALYHPTGGGRRSFDVDDDNDILEDLTELIGPQRDHEGHEVDRTAALVGAIAFAVCASLVVWLVASALAGASSTP